MKRKYVILFSAGVLLASLFVYRLTANNLIIQNTKTLIGGSAGRTAYRYISAETVNPQLGPYDVLYWNNGDCKEVKAYGYNNPTDC
jgi:hypothetical protein